LFDSENAEQYMCEVEGKLLRLTQKEIDIIKNTFHDVFQEQDHLWLFGSRVHSENISMIDRLHLLEKREFLPSVKLWDEVREARNDVTHEYPEDS
jgi:hypothetical protein